jgi:hypothetical protein
VLWDGRKDMAKERKIKKGEHSYTQPTGETSFKWTDYKCIDDKGI